MSFFDRLFRRKDHADEPEAPAEAAAPAPPTETPSTTAPPAPAEAAAPVDTAAIDATALADEEVIEAAALEDALAAETAERTEGAAADVSAAAVAATAEATGQRAAALVGPLAETPAAPTSSSVTPPVVGAAGATAAAPAEAAVADEVGEADEAAAGGEADEDEDDGEAEEAEAATVEEDEAEDEEPAERGRGGFSLFDRFRQLSRSVARTQEAFFGRIGDLFDRRSVDDSLYDDLEELMIQADMGMPTTLALVERLRERVRRDRIKEAGAAKEVLREEMVALLKVPGWDAGLRLPPTGSGIVLVVGVNGTGKTTSIAKLAYYLRRRGDSVALAAADTFRAAAIDQLKIWAERAGVPVVAHQPNADPGAVVFDGVQYALNRGTRVLLIDTAGRLHTKFNLMEELKKLRRVIQRLEPSGPHEVLLVLDATTGQNALQQAKHFTEAVEVTGIVLAKLDGTAKGGMAFAIAQELGLPIKFAGTGEKLGDLAEFDPDTFVAALLPTAVPITAD